MDSLVWGELEYNNKIKNQLDSKKPNKERGTENRVHSGELLDNRPHDRVKWRVGEEAFSLQ